MSHPIREVEQSSLSISTIQTDKSLYIQQDKTTQQWIETSSKSDDNNNGEYSETPMSSLAPGTTIRIQPMEWYCGGWADEHFNEYLKLPSGSQISKGIVVKLQAMARECVTVALSPNPWFDLGKTYAIHIGAAGNLQTVIRRRLPSQTEAVDICIPTPKICSDSTYKSFWIILQSNGQLSVGIGKIPGNNCIGTLDDSMYHALRSGVDAVKYVGLGNSALGRKAKDLKVRNVQVMSVPDCFPNNVIPLIPFDPLKNYDEQNEFGNGGENSALKEDAALWAEYQKECEKAQKRAIKFNVEYKQPPPDAFFKWSEARRMRANPERGFITGMDITSTEEKAKAGKRKERFEAEEKKNRELGIIGNGDDDKNEDDEMQDDNDDQVKKKREPLPLEQAWDNIDLVEQFRVDPPDNLTDDPNPAESDVSKMDDESDAITTVPEKIHLFAIDWAAFKQIRTDDIMGYFSMYGPSYVEWLGELSCNVLFGDKYSAARALEGMSRALPLEVPNSLTENNDSKKDEDDVMIDEENMEEMNTDIENGEQPTVTTDTDIATMDESNDPSKEDTAPDTSSADLPINENDNNNPTEPRSLANLGQMGWRFCNYPIRKRQDDRYGRRGTRSRILMRVANSIDVLEERPTAWPKPPPGFSTKVSARLLQPL